MHSIWSTKFGERKYKKKNQVDFANVNSDYSKYLLYVEFQYEFKTYYKKVRSKKLKHYKSTIHVIDFDAAEHSVYSGTVRTEWDQHRLPTWPKFKHKKEKKIVPRVHISWKGRQDDISNVRRIVQKHDQILIDYPWIKKKIFYKSADYKPEKQFYKDDDDEEQEEEEEPQEEQDDEYNENEDDNNGKDYNYDNNNNIIKEYFTITISSRYGS